MSSSLIRKLVVATLALCAPAMSLAGWLTPRDDTPRVLAVDEAFQVQPALWQDGQLLIGIDAAPGCYLYRDKFKVEALAPSGYALGAAQLPAGDLHHDEHFGDVRVYHNRLLANFRPHMATPPQRVRIRYQGCAENQVCYPPQERVLDVEAVH